MCGEPVKVNSSNFSCTTELCSYNYELINSSSKAQSGNVYIHLREHLPTMANTPKDLGVIEVPFDIRPNDTLKFSGSYKSDKELIAYFRVLYKKI